MRRCCLLLVLSLLAPAADGHADSQSFTLSTGYNESALTSGLNRGTAFEARVTRGHQLYLGSIDSRGLASVGFGRIASSQDIACNTHRYPVLTLFARPGEGPGFALDLHLDWFWRGTPARTPAKHLTVFQTQGGVICQQGEAPKARVTHRFVTSQRRFPGRTQGVEWVWEFRRDYPATYSSAGGQAGMSGVVRKNMRAESWAFFSREAGFGVLRVNIGATHKTVARSESSSSESVTPLQQVAGSAGGRTRVVPVLMLRLGYELRRW